ncbi:MAG: NAD(P)H-dependent oxidoreductase subunit E [Thermoleophilia bacterium]|nr:NAD(P)H-dependent oxidoreductase subunit E [Thermoleophilia bacterium]
MHDLSLYLLEVLENSVRAGAKRVDIEVFVDDASDRLRLTVDDDGQGLNASPEQTLDPFYTTKPGKRTGLGLSLLKADAQAAGGDLTIGPSLTLGGVRVETSMSLSHVDRPPLGDVGTSVIVMAATNPGIDFTVSLTGDRFTPPLEHAPPREAAERLSEEPIDKGVVNMVNDSEKQESSCQGCHCEEASEEELLARLDEVIKSYQGKPGALIPVLQLAQGIFGYLPDVVMERVATGLRRPYSEVAGVVGFYSFFSRIPRGRNLVRVCLGTACYVRGGMAVLDSLKKELKIDVGGTTDDREFSLEVARCFGACGLAPVITVNDIVHHRVKPARINEILNQYRLPDAETETVAVGAGERSN